MVNMILQNGYDTLSEKITLIFVKYT